MAGITLTKGTKIYTYGQPMTALHLITDGEVKAFYPGGELTLSKGDVIGINELCSEIHFLSYTVSRDAVILTYPITNIEALDDLLQHHTDMARFFLLSAFRQLAGLQNSCSLSQLKCGNLYHDLTGDYAVYTAVSSRYRLPVRPLRGIESATAYLNDESPDLWLGEFYAGLIRLYTGPCFKNLIQESAVSLGFLRKCSLDFRKTYTSAEEQHRYLRRLSGFYFNDEGDDLFERITSLAYKVGADSDEFRELLPIIERIIREYGEDNDCDPAIVRQRIDTCRAALQRMDTASAGEAPDSGSGLTAGLTGSLDAILDYAAVDLEIASSFRRHVQEYKALPDKADAGDKASRLRRALTEEFYVIYSVAFEKTLDSGPIPMPVRLFLYFGYVDEELAGLSNAAVLCRLAGQMTDHSAAGVYTFYDWLLAIFHGRKAPSRNEFGQDYSEYIHKQKLSGNISESELRVLEDSAMGKVNFELRNLFPTVNKITYGRVTTFCPVFHSEDVLKKLEDAYVTSSRLARALEMIRSVDYSAFYRESMDMEHLDTIGRETIHVEYLPDIILMPNIGIRGVLWQEIEGKVRNSPGRMFLSIFHLEDLDSTMIRMTGEFRWEMCKRVQGSRWNDISEASLTSEYFDYIQFYRKNRDLSAEAKEKLRSGLQRAKNSFKEMFIRDYLIWILFEGKNSPRMNKVARRIFFTYCPFPEKICRGMSQNPLYTELLDRRKIKSAQQLHRIEVLIKKLQNNHIPIPESLEREQLYVAGRI